MAYPALRTDYTDVRQVESTKVDEKMPIRVSSIRGQLRSWWRLLAMHKWQISGFTKPKQTLGWMNQGEDDGKASKVLLKVTNLPIKVKQFG